MQKIILLTGGGDLPAEVIKSLKKKKITFFCICFKNNPVSSEVLKYNYVVINFGNIITELIKLRDRGYKKILMIGNLRRPKLNEIQPDINSLKLIPQFSKILFEGGDNKLLNFVSLQLKKLEFKLIDIRKLMPELFLCKGNQTKKKPSKINFKDIKKGALILNSISKFDIGQSIVIQNGDVIGIEAAQGTDSLIKTSGSILKHGQDAVLVKLAKIKQNLKADLPTIGIQTVRNCKKNKIFGIAYSANKTLFLKKDKIIDYCNINKIFLIGI